MFSCLECQDFATGYEGQNEWVRLKGSYETQLPNNPGEAHGKELSIGNILVLAVRFFRNVRAQAYVWIYINNPL